jgi:hypothetical protein
MNGDDLSAADFRAWLVGGPSDGMVGQIDVRGRPREIGPIAQWLTESRGEPYSVGTRTYSPMARPRDTRPLPIWAQQFNEAIFSGEWRIARRRSEYVDLLNNIEEQVPDQTRCPLL